MGWVVVQKERSGGVGEDAAWSYTRLDIDQPVASPRLLLVNPTEPTGGRDKVLTPAMTRSKRGSHASSSLRADPLHQPPPRYGRTTCALCAGDGLACEGGAGCVGDNLPPPPCQGRVALPYEMQGAVYGNGHNHQTQAVGCTVVETRCAGSLRARTDELGGGPNHRRRAVDLRGSLAAWASHAEAGASTARGGVREESPAMWRSTLAIGPGSRVGTGGQG